MKNKTKKRSWLYNFYKENVMYVWVVVGIIVVSGFSIGMSLGSLTDNNNLMLDNGKVNNSNVNKNNTGNEQIAMNNDRINIANKDNEIVIDTTDDKVPTYISNRDRIEMNKNKEQASVTTNSSDVQKQNKPTVKKLEFIMPLEGEVSRNFTTDTLVFSNTLQAWISHEGIDILGDLATPVKAIEAGEVVEVKNDPRYGYIVIIDHGQGYQSIYCNLSTLDMVHVGKKVDKGQVISGIGNTALFEIKDNPHLHFELTKDGKTINPTVEIN